MRSRSDPRSVFLMCAWISSWRSEAGRSGSALLASGLFSLSFLLALGYTVRAMTPASSGDLTNPRTAYAERFRGPLDDEGFPPAPAWQEAPAEEFHADWRGENSDPQRSTEVRLLWTPQTLFVRFRCKYQSLTVYPDARSDGWRDELWERDVAETFLQPQEDDPWKYLEFEVSPNGYWIDLAISHGEKEELHSGLKRKVVREESRKVWTAVLALPMSGLTSKFDPQATWRVNFFRVEGEHEPRFYSAWSPTDSPQPNFHVPSRFGRLVFRGH